MHIERTQNPEVITPIVTHQDVWEWVSDDSCRKEDYKPAIVESCYWLLVIDDGEVLGAYFLHPHNMVTYEIHTCLLPAAWGKKAREAAKLVLSWMFANTGCMKVITNVPENNERAFAYAKRAGLSVEGINKSSFMKNGELLNQKMMGITKEEFVCQQQHCQQ